MRTAIRPWNSMINGLIQAVMNAIVTFAKAYRHHDTLVTSSESIVLYLDSVHTDLCVLGAGGKDPSIRLWSTNSADTFGKVTWYTWKRC